MTAGAQPPLVAHVIQSLGTGGLENGLVNLINRMPGHCYRHAVICLTESGPFERRLSRPGVEVIALHQRPGKDIRVYGRLWKSLMRLRPAIVHTRNLSALEAQIPAFFVPGVKRVHGVHGRDVFDLEGRNRKYNLLRRAIRPLVSRYIAVSQDLARWLVDSIGVAPGRVVQIYNGVDLERFRPAAPGERRRDLAPPGFLGDDAIVVGTVGRLAAVKDQASLIEAFARARRQVPALRLILAGDGPLRQPLSEQVARAGLSEVVWITGDRDDVPELLRLFHLFVLPSLGEGISNTILEAMATGLPVIATAVGGNPELVSEGVNGHLLPVRDPERLAHCIAALAGSEARRQALGRAGLERVRDGFDWERTVAGYRRVYDGLLGREPEAVIRRD